MHQGTSFRLEQVMLRYAPGAAPALQDFDLGIEPGESVALVGPSGAGKTTVLNLLNGSLRPTSGRVLVDGRDIAERGPAELRQLRASIGFVHQGLSLVDNSRAISNVIAGRFGRRSFLGAARSLLWPNPAERREVHALLERVGIADKLYQRVDRLSGGQRQRVALARALYQQPGALLADEPVSAVDPARARHALELLLEVSHERGLSLCVSLHDLALARELFPRLVGVRDGRALFDAPTAAVDEAMLAELFELEPAAAPI